MFKKLFSSVSINHCELPNRLAVTAMVTNYCNDDGTANERYIAYHEAKAKGGWGLIITEDYAINEHAMGYEKIAGLWQDEQIASHKELTDRIHKYDSKVFCQIYHAGRQSSHFVNGDMQPVAPSAIPCPWLRELPRELTIPEIEDLVEDFGDCALRAKKAGFDGVEIHAGHGYLIAEFLSSYVNKRTDRYGGNFQNRTRFLKEVYQNVRSKVGEDFPVIVRFSAVEDVPGSRNMAESRVLAELFADWGFDALNVSAGVYGDHSRQVVSPMYVPQAWQVDYAAEIKQLVDIPVFTVDRINKPEIAENILQMGKADIIGMGRASLADPEFPNKAKNGDLAGIRHCVACLQGCTGALYDGSAVKCLVNPTLGREYELDYSKTDAAKKIMVIGGGPGGLEAARSAALKGHQVSLYEKRSFLGGQLKSAAYPPCKGELTTYLNWVTAELEKLGVDIHLNTEVTKDLVLAEEADRVIVATGGKPVVPPIKGIDQPHVVTAEDVLLGNVATGDKIVIAGGGEVGSETAEHLAMQQREVAIVEMREDICLDLDGVNTYFLKKILAEYNVKSYVETKAVEIKADEVIVENKDGEFSIPVETVVLALGYQPENKLAEELADIDAEVITIAGAVKTADALAAIAEGFDTGIAIG